MLRLAAVSGVAGALAGCGAPESDGGNGGGEPDDGEQPDTPAEDEETGEDNEAPNNESDDGQTEGEDDTDDGEDGGDDADGEDGNGTAADGVADADEIVLDGITAGWEGVEPAAIEGEENPTLVLTEGNEYDIVWENADGEPHNIEIWDEEEEVVDEYSTEILEEEGERQTLTIEATAEMAEYVCVVHPTTMRGAVEIDGG